MALDAPQNKAGQTLPQAYEEGGVRPFPTYSGPDQTNLGTFYFSFNDGQDWNQINRRHNSFALGLCYLDQGWFVFVFLSFSFFCFFYKYKLNMEKSTNRTLSVQRKHIPRSPDM